MACSPMEGPWAPRELVTAMFRSRIAGILTMCSTPAEGAWIQRRAGAASVSWMFGKPKKISASATAAMVSSGVNVWTTSRPGRSISLIRWKKASPSRPVITTFMRRFPPDPDSGPRRPRKKLPLRRHAGPGRNPGRHLRQVAAGKRKRLADADPMIRPRIDPNRHIVVSGPRKRLLEDPDALLDRHEWVLFAKVGQNRAGNLLQGRDRIVGPLSAADQEAPELRGVHGEVVGGVRPRS